jgi:plasmid stabilization system protein ParE
MSKPRIVLTLDAERDLDLLFDWIAQDSSVERAEAILRRIEEALDLVAGMPRIGRVRHDLDGEPRTFAVWPWLIVYEPLPTAQGVVVWRIIDGRRDVPRHLR